MNSLPMIAVLATLSVGTPNDAPEQNIYVQGAGDAYISEHISFRTDLFWYAGEQHQSGRLADNHSLLAGFSYHPVDGRALDPYLGAQPGFSLTQRQAPRAPTRFSPVVSPVVGGRLFVTDLFHFFVEGRQVLGQHLGGTSDKVPLAETRVCFGLGAQIGGRSR